LRTKYYDVVFYGGSVSGLLCAINLLKRGFKVLILDSGNHFYPFEKEKLSSSPVTYFGGFTLRNLLRSLGFHPLEINKLRAVDPSLQVIIQPDIRFDLYSDEKRLLGELKREFPDIWGEANNFFNKQLTSFTDIYPKIFMSGLKFPPEGFLEKRRLKKYSQKLSNSSIDNTHKLEDLLGGMGKNRDFLLLFKAIINSVSDLSHKKYSLPYLSQLVGTERFDGYEFEGGLKGFHEMIMAKVKERGGIVLDSAKIKEISVSGSQVNHLLMEGCAIDKLVLSHFIINGNPKSLFKLFPGSKRNFVLKRRFGKIKPKYVKYTFYIKLRKDVFPEGMQERVILIDDRQAELCSENFLYIHKFPNEQDDNDDEIVTLAVSTYLKPDELGGIDFMNRFTAKCKDKIEKIVPYMDEYFVSIDTPPIKRSEELENDLKARFIYDSDFKPYFGISALPYTTYLKNMFFIGQSVFPGLGFDGEVQSGLRVSRHISASSKIKRP